MDACLPEAGHILKETTHLCCYSLFAGFAWTQQQLMGGLALQYPAESLPQILLLRAGPRSPLSETHAFARSELELLSYTSATDSWHFVFLFPGIQGMPSNAMKATFNGQLVRLGYP